ncbi:hypothetical protein CMK18_22325 [Candidatus Poribacteria bacterium]|nr:hypothetical protein [Candidatus Poribacteria bacterium]
MIKTEQFLLDHLNKCDDSLSLFARQNKVFLSQEGLKIRDEDLLKIFKNNLSCEFTKDFKRFIIDALALIKKDQADLFAQKKEV